MKLTNQEKSSYLIWVAVNLLLLLSLGELKFGNSYFYPFSNGFENVKDYDITEFLAYTLVPLLVIVAVKFNSESQPANLLEQAQKSATPLIVKAYRKIADERLIAPTSKTSDNKIIEIYSKVGRAFNEASKQRNEHIPAGYLNTIVLGFYQVYEMGGDVMLDEHLQYEVNKYLKEGLRDDYKQETNII